jgi:hypothetical protein
MNDTARPHKATSLWHGELHSLLSQIYQSVNESEGTPNLQEVFGTKRRLLKALELLSIIQGNLNDTIETQEARRVILEEPLPATQPMNWTAILAGALLGGAENGISVMDRTTWRIAIQDTVTLGERVHFGMIVPTDGDLVIALSNEEGHLKSGFLPTKPGGVTIATVLAPNAGQFTLTVCLKDKPELGQIACSFTVGEKVSVSA